MIGNLNLKVSNDREAIKQIVNCDYTDIINVVARTNCEPAYVLRTWLQLPERRRLEKAGFKVQRTVSGGTFIYE